MTDTFQTANVGPKVFIALPAYGQMVLSPTVSSLLATARALDAAGLNGGFGTLSYPDIVEIRNILVSIWYDRIQTSHMLFIDADMSFPPQLIMDMIRFGKPLVGALAPKKKIPTEFAGRAKQGEVKIVNGFMEVSGVGGAIMLISRETVTAMLQKWPELSDTTTIKNHAAKSILEAQGVNRIIKVFNKIHIDGEEFSEDLSFCHRWTMCGGDVWANIVHTIGHVGMHEYSGAYYDVIKDHIRPSGDAPVDSIQPAMLPMSSVSAEIVGAVHANGDARPQA